MAMKTKMARTVTLIVVMVSVLFLMESVGEAEVRTWTSKTGNTVEAEYLRREGPVVFLRTSDGGDMRIHGSQLSPADIQYVKTQPITVVKASSPEEKSVVPVVNKKEPEPKPVAEKKPAPVKKSGSGPFAYEPMKKVTSAELGFPEPRKPSEAYRLAFRFGEKADDVMYCMLDTETWENNADRLYVMIPGHTQYGKPTLLKGKSKKITGNPPAFLFKDVPVKAAFGDMQVSMMISVSMGEPVKGLVGVRADVTLQKGRDRSRFLLKGALSEQAAYAEDRFPPVELLGQPALQVGGKASAGMVAVSGLLTMNHLSLMGISGMDKQVQIQLINEKGKAAKKLKWKLDEEDVYKLSHGHRYTIDQVKLKPGAYTLSSVSDLGPQLGKVEPKPSKVKVK